MQYEHFAVVHFPAPSWGAIALLGICTDEGWKSRFFILGLKFKREKSLCPEIASCRRNQAATGRSVLCIDSTIIRSALCALGFVNRIRTRHRSGPTDRARSGRDKGGHHGAAPDLAASCFVPLVH